MILEPQKCTISPKQQPSAKLQISGKLLPSNNNNNNTARAPRHSSYKLHLRHQLLHHLSYPQYGLKLQRGSRHVCFGWGIRAPTQNVSISRPGERDVTIISFPSFYSLPHLLHSHPLLSLPQLTALVLCHFSSIFAARLDK